VLGAASLRVLHETLGPETPPGHVLLSTENRCDIPERYAQIIAAYIEAITPQVPKK